MVRPFYFKKDTLYVLDQRFLPHKEIWIKCKNYEDVSNVIKKMIVRGAPLIGVVAGYGLYFGAKEGKFYQAYKKLKNTRPTAKNLFFALERIKKVFEERRDILIVLKEAKKIEEEDRILCNRIAEFGAKLIKRNSKVLTHCNAGGLATAGIGTALGIIKKAKRKIKIVWVDETRPYLQGARLTSWELEKEKIPYKIICDNMAGFLMRKGEIDCIIVGADRITRNGDVANKIGTYSLSILAKFHKIPFYVAAPYSTFDLTLKDGSEIPIEERSEREIKEIQGKKITPIKAKVFNPAFDVTPHNLITAIITEKGIIKNPDKKKIMKFYKK